MYLERGNRRAWSSGILRAYQNQTKALLSAGVQYTTDPREEFDLLHVHSIGPRSVYLVEKYAGRLPIVINSHTTAEDFANGFRMSDSLAPYLGRFLRYFYNRADMLIAPSAYTRDLLRRSYEVDRPIEVVSNGVDFWRFQIPDRKRAAARRRFGLSGTVVFAVGLILLRKGVDMFCEVAARVPELTFVWFGRLSKAVKAETRRIIDEAPANVRFPGYVDDVTETYAAGDLFFFPSLVENEGIAVLEAAAAGRPLVLRDAECFAGRYIHEENCLKGGNAEEFAAHLRRLAADEALRRHLGGAARAFAARHTLDRIGTRLREIYSRLM